jgi:hypothetical protein
MDTLPAGLLNASIQSIWKLWRRHKLRQELLRCSPAELAAIAYDLRLNSTELMRLVTDKAEPFFALKELLAAAGINAKDLAIEKPHVMRELQRACLACGRKPECARHRARGTFSGCYRDFCPNAFTLDDLAARNSQADCINSLSIYPRWT